MRSLPSLLSLALLALMLVGCGNKGPLVLPSPDESEIVPDPAESADEASDAVPTGATDDKDEPQTPPKAGTPDRSGH